MDGVVHFSWCVFRRGNREEVIEAWILVAGEGAEPLHLDGNLLVAHEAAIKPRNSPIGQNVADGAIHLIVGVAVVGPVVADRKSTRLNSSHANISYAVF